jgi:hypothetical protein
VMTMAVILARSSAPGRACSIAGSRAVDCTHRFGCRMRICVLCGQGWPSPLEIAGELRWMWEPIVPCRT